MLANSTSRAFARRSTALLLATAASALATSALAQSVAPSLPTVPLHDADCNFETTSPVMTVPPCTVNGTRTVTNNGRTRTVRNSTTDFLIDNYSVAFSGNLAIEGQPIVYGPSPVFPFGNTGGPGFGPVEASYFFGSTGQTVNVTANYTGEKIQIVTTGAAGVAPVTDPAHWSRVTNLTGTVNSIAIDLDSYFETSDGGEYEFTLASLNPANVVNNSTALAGKFNGEGGTNGAIQFGTLTGTATVTPGYGPTPYPADTGANNTGLLSLYNLAYGIQATVTTSLDETGLITPKVAVSQGIEMNGSKISGLAAGTVAGDAINKGQLDAAIAAVSAGASPFLAVATQTTPASASGVNALAVGGSAAATALQSTAVGNGATAASDQGVAMGFAASGLSTGGIAIGNEARSSSTGTGNIAIGGNDRAADLVQGTVANGGSAIALGQRATATALGAIAIGGDGGGSDGRDPAFPGAFATGVRSTAIGTDSVATGATSVALGSRATAVALDAVAIGNSSFAQGTDTTAIGHLANAIGSQSVAIGSGSEANQANTVSVGSNTNQRRIVNVAAGIAGTDAVNKAQLDAAIASASAGGEGSIYFAANSTQSATTASGIEAISVGGGSIASGDGSLAIGSDNPSDGDLIGASATALLATAVGSDALATGVGSSALGADARAIANGATAVGLASRATDGSATAIGKGADADLLATAIGADSRARGIGSFAGGSSAIANGEGSVAIGLSAQTAAANSVAIGNQTLAFANATAVGPGAVASQVASTALGRNARASADQSTALGSNAQASGYASSAIGADSVSSGYQAMASGVFARAIGDYSMAFGRATFAAGTQAMAMGPLSSASGDNATAVGGQAVASGAGASALGATARATTVSATAVGQGAQATHANSTAVGAGAQTTAANQLVLGTAQTAVRVAGIDASTSAQQGPVDVVTVDANGTLGRQRAATAQSVQEVRVAMDMIAAVTDSQFDALSGTVQGLGARVTDLEFRLDDLNRSTSGGIAAAMAMGGTMVVPDSTVSLSVNASTYRGEQGYSGSVVAKVGEKLYVSGAIGGSSVAKSRGGRVGMAVGF